MHITKEKNIITGVYDGKKNHPEGIDVPDSFQGNSGDRIELFDSNWNVRPFIDLVSDGLAIVPAGYKIKDNQIVEKSEIEKYTDGDLPIPTGYKIENNELVVMSDDDQLAANIITQAEYNDKKISVYQNILDTTDWYSIRYAETGKEIPADIRNARIEARNKISELQTNK